MRGDVGDRWDFDLYNVQFDHSPLTSYSITVAAHQYPHLAASVASAIAYRRVRTCNLTDVLSP